MWPNLIVPYQYYLFSLFRDGVTEYTDVMNNLVVFGYDLEISDYEMIKAEFAKDPQVALPNSKLYFPGHPLEYFLKSPDARVALEALILTETDYPEIQKAMKRLFRANYCEEHHNIIVTYFINFNEMRFDYLKKYLQKVPEHYELLFMSAAEKNDFLVKHLLNLKPDIDEQDIAKTILTDSFAKYQAELSKNNSDEARKWAKICMDLLAKKQEDTDDPTKTPERTTVEFDNMSDIADAPPIIDLTPKEVPACPEK